MKPLAMKASAILAITITDPERLFTTPQDAKNEYIALLKQWHPDVNHDARAVDVTAHINRLWQVAEDRIAAHAWQTPGELLLRAAGGKTYRVRYRKRRTFELGELYYGEAILCWMIRNEFADLVESARRTISGLPFAMPEMRTEMARYLPKIRQIVDTADGTIAVVMDKTPDAFLLQDVLDALGGTMDPKHVAWIVSSLSNIACYLEFAKIAHNAIALDTCFVSPEHHSVMLYGGWWYATPTDAHLSALPPRSRAIAPHRMIAEKRAEDTFDRLLVRILGRELLGDPTGMLLAGAAPQPFVDFLRRPPSASAVTDYQIWRDSVLPASFGARRFVKLEMTARDIFKE